MTVDLGRVVVTGGSGFVGSHLCERFLVDGSEVVCADNLLTGKAKNVDHLRDDARFHFLEIDVARGIDVDGPDIVFVDRPVEDPTVRQPDITPARELLGWEPKVPLEEALERTVRWFRTTLGG